MNPWWNTAIITSNGVTGYLLNIFCEKEVIAAAVDVGIALTVKTASSLKLHQTALIQAIFSTMIK